MLRDPEADVLFKALSDSTRRDILIRTLHVDHSVSELSRLYPMSFAAVQKHVATLERAGLVTKEKQGREQLVRTNIDSIRKTQRLLEGIEEMWRGRLDRFGEALNDSEQGDNG